MGRVLMGAVLIGALVTYIMGGGRSEKYKGVPNTVTGAPLIVDGDTVRFYGVAGYDKVRVRLQGIDAPESKQYCKKDNQSYPCGEQSHQALLDFVGRNLVTCVAEGVDRYKRMIGRCSVGGSENGADMGEYMVKNGYAVAYRRYDDTYIPAEDSARKNRLGLWSGQFVLPEKWRRGERLK